MWNTLYVWKFCCIISHKIFDDWWCIKIKEHANECNHWKWYSHQCASCPKLLCLENLFEFIWNKKFCFPFCKYISNTLGVRRESKRIIFLEHTKPKLYVLYFQHNPSLSSPHPPCLFSLLPKNYIHQRSGSE